MGAGNRRHEHRGHPGQTDEGLARHGQPEEIEGERWRETAPEERPGYDEGPERPSQGDIERPPEQDEADTVILGEEVGEPVEITPDERGEIDPRRDD
jgi:hypothetical protein